MLQAISYSPNYASQLKYKVLNDGNKMPTHGFGTWTNVRISRTFATVLIIIIIIILLGKQRLPGQPVLY